MSDTFYFFYQKEAKSSWTLGLASDRDRVNREIKPELNTVLDVNCAFDKDLAAEEKDRLKYSGPCYFDFDAEDIEEAIPNFQQFLINLKAKGVNLDALRLYASGGKGFHIEMPQPMLMAKLPIHGTQALPLIYREIAHELYVNTLDLRVYSLGKGRQWRVPNVKRANGKFKVQITAEEAFNMTVEMYDTITSYSRPLFPVEEQGMVPDMGLLFSRARDKVWDGIKNRKKRVRSNDELKRFKGEWPETVKSILMGQDIKENVGWNHICVQLAIVADALGKTEEQLLKDAEGLIDTYAGDSERYGTPRKRRIELQNKFRYMQENPCYEFSKGGILSIVEKSVQANSDLNLGEYEPDGHEEEDAQAEGGTPQDDEDIPTAIRMNRNGIYARTENGWKNISHVSFIKPIELMLPEGKTLGYDVEIFVDGYGKGRHPLSLPCIATKSALHNYAQRFNASFRGTDMDAANLIDMMRHKTRASKQISYVSQREGMDFILPPDAVDENDFDVIWTSPTAVVTREGCKRNYTFHPLDDAEPTFRSDLMKAPDLTVDDADFISNFLSINTKENMARLLGWFSATFVCPILRYHFNKFPLLQIYGTASAGKSATLAMLAQMHYFLIRPRLYQASSTTAFAVVKASASSSSIPLLLEELRVSKLKANGRADWYLNQLKSNYDGHDVQRGQLGQQGKGAAVTTFANTAPIAFVSEEQHGDTAVQERSVNVNLTAQDRLGRDRYYAYVEEHAKNFGRLGKALAMHVINMDVQEFLRQFRVTEQVIKDKLKQYGDLKNRPIYNLTTVVAGLDLCEAVLTKVFGSQFEEEFEAMRNGIMSNLEEYVPKNMSEPAKVLDVFAQLSKSVDASVRLERNKDYYLDEAAGTVDIKLKPAYAKYLKYVRSLGLTPVFESDAAFIGAMNRFDATVLKACPDSPLFTSVREVIYRFNLEQLSKDNVEDFKP